jgi:hypothetical protein
MIFVSIFTKIRCGGTNIFWHIINTKGRPLFVRTGHMMQTDFGAVEVEEGCKQ